MPSIGVVTDSGHGEYENGDVAELMLSVYQTLPAPKVLVNPATVQLKITKPSGAINTYTYAGSDIVRDSLGQYRYELPLTTGEWGFTWSWSGPTGSRSGTLSVKPSQVP